MVVDKSVWNANELKETKEPCEGEALKAFRVNWIRDYREYGYAVVKARTAEEAEEKFWNDDYEDEAVEDSESVNCHIDSIMEM